MQHGRPLLKLVSVGGVPLRVHPAMLVLLGGLLASRLFVGGTEAFRLGLGLLMLVICVTGHEAGHAVAARRMGLHVEDISFHLLFAACRTEQPRRPLEEVLVALGGPVANLLMSLMAWSCLLFLPAGGLGAEVADHALLFNLVLGLANLLPAFPMDGGRILRAVLHPRYGMLTATRAAVWTGRALALGALLVPVVLGPDLRHLVVALGGVLVLGLGEMERRRIQQAVDPSVSPPDARPGAVPRHPPPGPPA